MELWESGYDMKINLNFFHYCFDDINMSEYLPCVVKLFMSDSGN